MKIEQNDIDSQEFDNFTDLVIIPELAKNGQDIYSSEIISFHKYANNQIKLDYLKKPDLLLEQRSAEWFGPTLLITTAALTQNTELISIALSVISNYLTEYFKGRKEPNIKISFITQKSKTQFTKFDYEGDKEGLKEFGKLLDQFKK